MDANEAFTGNEQFVVDFQSVAKTYDGIHFAVRDLDLAVRKGEFLTILGPSGSGKTTILMMLAGFERPTAGQVRMRGRDLAHVPPYRRDIGVVFQSYALFPHKTVAENIAYPLRRRRVPRHEIADRVRSIMGTVNLVGYDERMPHELSGGQQQRVALARALVFKPSLVLMDEPLGSLDRKLREQMQYELKRIHRTARTTFLYVTHDQDEALALSDRIAVLDAGRVQQVESPQVVYDIPANLFVASFIGENNVLQGRVSRVDQDYCVISLPDGAEIIAPRRDDEQSDRLVHVCIRPENVALADGTNRFPNRLRGMVSELIYYGDHTRLVVDVPGQTVIIAKVRNSGLGSGMGPGREVSVGWDKDHCVVLHDPVPDSLAGTAETPGR